MMNCVAVRITNCVLQAEHQTVCTVQKERELFKESEAKFKPNHQVCIYVVHLTLWYFAVIRGLKQSVLHSAANFQLPTVTLRHPSQNKATSLACSLPLNPIDRIQQQLPNDFLDLKQPPNKPFRVLSGYSILNDNFLIYFLAHFLIFEQLLNGCLAVAFKTSQTSIRSQNLA